jgi:hypothetical protein
MLHDIPAQTKLTRGCLWKAAEGEIGLEEFRARGRFPWAIDVPAFISA